MLYLEGLLGKNGKKGSPAKKNDGKPAGQQMPLSEIRAALTNPDRTQQRCTRCGDCCQNMRFPPFRCRWESEDDRVAPGSFVDFLDLPKDAPTAIRQQLVAILTDEGASRQLGQLGHCLWYDPETRRCRNYQFRPEMCRNFVCWAPLNGTLFANAGRVQEILDEGLACLRVPFRAALLAPLLRRAGGDYRQEGEGRHPLQIDTVELDTRVGPEEADIAGSILRLMAGLPRWVVLDLLAGIASALAPTFPKAR